MNLSKATDKVIDLARKVRDYYTAELPKRHPSYPVIGIDEESVAAPPEEQELRKFLLGLPDDLVYQMTLLMYLGRGDFGTDNLAESYEDLRGTFTEPGQAASQMIDKAPLADYLLDGLEVLRQHKISVDKLPLKKVQVRNRR
jgi:Protein of unknown function (DUF3775)